MLHTHRFAWLVGTASKTRTAVASLVICIQLSVAAAQIPQSSPGKEEPLGVSAANSPVTLVEDAVDASAGELPCYKIVTPSATYYLETSGGGISSLVDREGHDWIGFHPQPGSESTGEYRGFPNAVHLQGGNYFHPKNHDTDRCSARLLVARANLVSIQVTSDDRQWSGRYDFRPTHCTFTITRMPEGRKYWILYEGVPGGSFDESDWWMSSAGPRRRTMASQQNEDLPPPEWIVFGDKDIDRVLFLLHHTDDAHPDRFYAMRNQMTVFGFGRSGLQKYLDHVPQQFSIGFVESTSHPVIAAHLQTLLSSAPAAASKGPWDDAARRLGLEVLADEIDLPVRTAYGVIDAQPAAPDRVLEYGRLLSDELTLYPKSLVSRSKLRRIVLCKDLRFAGQRRNAVPDFEHHTLYLDVQRGAYNRNYMRKVIHHEFFHIVDLRDDGQLYGDPAWQALNPEEFSYGRGGKTAQELASTSVLSDLYPGFLNHYSTTGVEEDKAEVFAHLIVEPETVARRAANDPVLAAKIQRMKKLLWKFSPEMTDKFWNGRASR